MPLLQAYEENLGQGFQELQSDLDRVEEKQNSVLRYMQAEVSAESSIRNLSLQKRLLILTLVRPVNLRPVIPCLQDHVPVLSRGEDSSSAPDRDDS